MVSSPDLIPLNLCFRETVTTLAFCYDIPQPPPPQLIFSSWTTMKTLISIKLLGKFPIIGTFLSLYVLNRRKPSSLFYGEVSAHQFFYYFKTQNYSGYISLPGGSIHWTKKHVLYCTKSKDIRTGKVLPSSVLPRSEKPLVS